MHQRVCEPLTRQACVEPFLNLSYNGLTTQPCPPQHTCSTILGSWDPPRQFGYINPSGERTQGTQITIEVGTEYVELGAMATDNLKHLRPLQRAIQIHANGPLKHWIFVERYYPVYSREYMINKAYAEYLAQRQAEDPYAWVEAEEVVEIEVEVDMELE